MTYVPVQVWVPDTVDGPVTDTVNLKACDQCDALIIEGQMDDHIAKQHSQEVTPH
jgi:hypothetical protein